MTRTSGFLVVLILGSGCGIRHVPLKVLEQLPYEAKIELLEAENDLALAVDRLDEAQSEVTRTTDLIRRAKDRSSDADDEVGNAADANAKEVAKLAVVEAEARVEWLRARQRVNVREQDLAEKGLTCAEARYEVARLTSARKAKLEGSEKLDPADFDKQLKSCEDDYAQLRDKSKEQGKEAETMRADWEKARSALAKKTFDARASPFVE